MDYKQKYKEALERAKKVHKYSSDLAEIKRMEHVFPELRESEDEKIRKSLLRWLQSNSYTSIAGIQINDVIGWLKKQGEQKSVIIIPKFRVGDEVITENEESLTITRIDEEGYWSNDLFICDFDEECIWDLVEQKPIEWKQENREELTEFENAMMHIGGSFFGENAGLDPNDTAAIKEQAELLLELAPKTEWSEEDEKRLESCLNILQPKTLLGNNVETINTKWLKSLRQKMRWKPTKEQMYFLSWIANVKLGNSIVDQTVSKYLNELYEDLKKL